MTPTKTKPQSDKFKDAAGEHETDDSEEAFDRMLKKVAKRTKQPSAPKGKPKD